MLKYSHFIAFMISRVHCSPQGQQLSKKEKAVTVKKEKVIPVKKGK
jgi:hypothetical protein